MSEYRGSLAVSFAPARDLSLLLGSVVLAGAVLAPSHTARACTYVPVNFSVLSERVPVAGPILVDVDCQQTEYCRTGAMPSLVVSEAGTPVSGTLEMVRGDISAFLVFRPSVPLRDGREYRIELPEIAGQSTEQELTIRADASFSWLDATEPTWTFGDAAEDTGERLCCFAGQACFDHCFTEQRTVKAVLTPGVLREPARAATVYSLRWTEADGTVRRLGLRRASRFKGPTQWDLRAPFDQPAAKYCATLEMRNLVDGRSRELTHCSDPNRSVPYGQSVPFTPDATQLADCQVPPGVDFECQGADCKVPSERYRHAWCKANASACVAQRLVGRCEQFQRFCSGVAVDGTETPDAGTSEPAPHPAPAQVGAVRETAAVDDAAAADDTAAANGCSAAPDPRRGSSLGWLLSAALLVRLQRRVRRSSR